MGIPHLIALGIFVGAYIVITFEHQLKTQKAPVAMVAAVVLWGLIALFGVESMDHIRHDMEVAMAETASIVLFLLMAMTIIEILVHYRVFDWMRIRLYRLGWNDQRQFLLICTLTFFLSAVLDNLTITIVMVQISLRFFQGRNRIIAAAGIVIAANAGGAFSPIGDVTTIMLWLAQKFSTGEIIKDVFFPAAIHALVACGLLSLQVTGNNGDSTEELDEVQFSRSELVVIALCLVSFALPLVVTTMGLQPFMGLLFGLGLVWLAVGFFRLDEDAKETHLTADIHRLMTKVDFPSLLFFVGILLAVSALNTLGLLEQLSHLLLGEAPSFERMVATNIGMGYLSSIVDNVPLTALMIDLLQTNDTRLWTLLAYAVGTGGSHLVIGSVAGVVAMGMVKELTSSEYFKIATRAVAAGYIAGIVVWVFQIYVLGF